MMNICVQDGGFGMGENKHIVKLMAMRKRHVRQRDQLLLSFFSTSCFCEHIVESIIIGMM